MKRRRHELAAWQTPGDIARAERLESDYLEAELVLQRLGIEHAIVVFGSTRISEPALAAAARGGRAHRLRGATPDRCRAAPARCAAPSGSRTRASYYDVAREFGRHGRRAAANPDPRHAAR